MVVKDEKAAKSLSEERASKRRDNRLAKKGVVSLDGIFAGAGDSAKPSVNLIIKTDTNGSAEAIAGAINNLKVEEANIKIVLDAMYGSTNEQFGTSFRSRHKDKKYRYAGKTGTSQVRRITEKDRELDLDTSEIEYKNRDHALFVAFAPYKNPQYAISVLVEHGGSGGKAAAPIAKKVIKKVLERHELRRSVNNQIGESV